jgi:hypothetical protein
VLANCAGSTALTALTQQQHPGEGQIVDMVREPTVGNPRCDGKDRVMWSDDDRLEHYLDRLFARMAAEPMSSSLKQILTENKLLLSHR